ncbi:hypothetical protein Gotur_026984 [Gossypium turneri]
MKLDMFVQLKNLEGLDLSNVSLLIESDNRRLTFPQLKSLSLSSCNLTEFLEFIKRQDKLVDLDLSNNHIHGFVPNWLWKSGLSRLDLSFNMIDFPKQLPLNDANFSLPMLTVLDLRSCNISAFPEFLKRCGRKVCSVSILLITISHLWTKFYPIRVQLLHRALSPSTHLLTI